MDIENVSDNYLKLSNNENTQLQYNSEAEADSEVTSETFSDIVIGIDLGTTNSVVAIYENDSSDKDIITVIKNEFGVSTTPSVVFYTKSANCQSNLSELIKPETVVGKLAVSNMARFPTRTIYGVKRLIGRQFNLETATQFNYQVIPDKYNNNLIRLANNVFLYPEQVSAEILLKMKMIAEQYLQHSVKRAVITVPAYFDDGQRFATKIAAEIAGLEVLRIINEPTAACLCYGIDKLEGEFNVLVFDCGGGTTDLSLLSLNNGLFEVIATNGDSDLGGMDFDLLLMNYLIEKYNLNSDIQNSAKHKTKLLEASEQLKITLSISDTATYSIKNFFNTNYNLIELEGKDSRLDLVLNLNYEEWVKIIQPLVDKAKILVNQILKDSGIYTNQISQIVLVGGSSKLRPLRDMLKEIFPTQKLNFSVNPDEAVAYGAAIQAKMLQNKIDNNKSNSIIKDIVLVDVTPLSLGIETEGGLMSVIIPRNTSIPCTKVAYYTTVYDNQTEVTISVFCGERLLTKDNKCLGTFKLIDIQEMSRGFPKIKVEFKINVDGILDIKAVDEMSNKEYGIIIDSSNIRISENELKLRLEDAKNQINSDELQKEKICQQKETLELVRELKQMYFNCLNNKNKLETSDIESNFILEKLNYYQELSEFGEIKINNYVKKNNDLLECLQIETNGEINWNNLKIQIEEEILPYLNKIFNRDRLKLNLNLTVENDSNLTVTQINNYLEDLFINI